jgi:hypothetical protein
MEVSESIQAAGSYPQSLPLQQSPHNNQTSIVAISSKSIYHQCAAFQKKLLLPLLPNNNMPPLPSNLTLQQLRLGSTLLRVNLSRSGLLGGKNSLQEYGSYLFYFKSVGFRESEGTS